MRGMILPAALLLWAACGLGAPEKKEPLQLRDDVVAVVLTSRSAGSGTINLSYPNRVDKDQVAQDLTTMAGVTKWLFGPPSVTARGTATEATAEMTPSVISGNAVHPVWPVIWALQRFNRVTIAFLDPGSGAMQAPQPSRYVPLVWSGSGQVWLCDATIQDRGFKSLEELSAPLTPPGGKDTEGSTGKGSAHGLGGWYALLALAVLAGVVTYVALSRRQSRSR